MLVKVDGNNGPKYLDSLNLDFRNECQSLAYVLDARIGNSDIVGTFFRFYLRDVNGFTVTARMFNTSIFDKKGYALSIFKKKPVLVTYTASAYGGPASLVLSDIQIHEGEFDYGKFLGLVEKSQEYLEHSNNILSSALPSSNYMLPSLWTTESYVDVCNGRSGGMSKLSYMVIKQLFDYFDTPGVEKEKLMVCAYKSLIVFGRYLSIKQVMDVPMKHQLLEIIYTNSVDLDLTMKNIVADCCAAVIGLGEPQHLYAHIISRTIHTAKDLLNYSFEYPLIEEGSSKRVGDKTLSRY
jgi:hypothetical protein